MTNYEKILLSALKQIRLEVKKNKPNLDKIYLLADAAIYKVTGK